jgi:hypothetical protein
MLSEHRLQIAARLAAAVAPLAALELHGVRGLWPLQSGGAASASRHTALCLSFVASTAFLALDAADGALEGLDAPGAITDAATFYCGSVTIGGGATYWVQAAEHGVVLLDAATRARVVGTEGHDLVAVPV